MKTPFEIEFFEVGKQPIFRVSGVKFCLWM